MRKGIGRYPVYAAMCNSSEDDVKSESHPTNPSSRTCFCKTHEHKQPTSAGYKRKMVGAVLEPLAIGTGRFVIELPLDEDTQFGIREFLLAAAANKKHKS